MVPLEPSSYSSDSGLRPVFSIGFISHAPRQRAEERANEYDFSRCGY